MPVLTRQRLVRRAERRLAAEAARARRPHADRPADQPPADTAAGTAAEPAPLAGLTGLAG
jgi:hypothetical protein